jgi:hypothetical protein
MSKRRNARATSARKGRRFSIPVVASIVILAAAAITVVSRQIVTGKSTATTAETKYVTVKVAGQDVQVNSQTGQIKPLTPQEARQLAAGLRGMLNTSTEGLVAVKQPDGSTALDLQGRFQNVAVARVNDDGTLTQSCIDNPQAAAVFFGIDPQLLGVTTTATQTNQPAKSATVKSTLQ